MAIERLLAGMQAKLPIFVLANTMRFKTYLLKKVPTTGINIFSCLPMRHKDRVIVLIDGS